jgi:O-antigen/teichoic acid export membrane protein
MRLAAPILVVKCVAQVASGAFMISLGRPTAMAVFTVSGGLLNVALNFALIPAYGAPGAVYSTLIGHALIGITSLAYATRGVLALGRAPVSTGAS